MMLPSKNQVKTYSSLRSEYNVDWVGERGEIDYIEGLINSHLVINITGKAKQHKKFVYF